VPPLTCCNLHFCFLYFSRDRLVNNWKIQSSNTAFLKLFLGWPKSEFDGHLATQDANIVFKKILIVWVIFGSELLGSISKSEIYSFLKYLYITEWHRQSGDVENTQFCFGSPHLGATHCFTLRDPSLGRERYFGNHCSNTCLQLHFNFFCEPRHCYDLK